MTDQPAYDDRALVTGALLRIAAQEVFTESWDADPDTTAAALKLMSQSHDSLIALARAHPWYDQAMETARVALRVALRAAR